MLAAGDGKLSEEEETKKAYDKVRDAIDHNDKTITLSVGQLTTGITVPEWTAVLMLSNIKSPALYMQAAFRSQNPWRYQENGTLHVTFSGSCSPWLYVEFSVPEYRQYLQCAAGGH